jgi:hypothetical protein
MAQIIVRTRLAVGSALAQRLCSAGDLEVRPSPEQLSAIEHPEALEPYCHLEGQTAGHSLKRLSVETIGWSGVVEGLEDLVLVAAANAAAKAAEREQIVQKVLALRDSGDFVEWQFTEPDAYYHPQYSLSQSHIWLCEVGDDPRIKSWLPQVIADADAQLAVYQKARAAHERACKDKKEAKARETEANALRVAQEQRDYVLAHAEAYDPTLVRAAREGRVVTRALREIWQARIEEVMVKALPVGGRSVEVYRQSARDDVPSAQAYALFDALLDSVHRLEAVMDGSTTVRVGEIKRSDVHPSNNRHCWRTTVQVRCEHPWFEAWAADYTAEDVPSFDEQEDDE